MAVEGEFHLFAVTEYAYSATDAGFPFRSDKDHRFGEWCTFIRIALAAEEPGGVFGQAENIRGSRKFEVGQQSPTVIEHGPIAVGESMRREVVVMRLLHIGCLLEQSHLARAAGLSGKAFLREHIAPPFLFEPGIHGEIFPVAVF